jgi:hypothetical protein
VESIGAAITVGNRRSELRILVELAFEVGPAMLADGLPACGGRDYQSNVVSQCDLAAVIQEDVTPNLACWPS